MCTRLIWTNLLLRFKIGKPTLISEFRMLSIPHLQLTRGQVAWALCGGQKPDRHTLDSLRYLRLLGVPFVEEEQGVGTGNRLTYTFDHLIECAVAMYAVRRGMKPGQGAAFLVGDRQRLRKIYRKTFRDSPDGALEAPWVKSRGKTLPPLNDAEEFIRLHKNYSDLSGKIEVMTLEEVVTFQAGLGDYVERYADGVVPLVPLRRVSLEAVAWALEAPVTKPGRVRASEELKS